MDEIKIIYVYQFGGWWSFTPKNWIRMLKDWCEGVVNYNDYGKKLKNKPYHNVSITEDEEFRDYSPKNETIMVYRMPCDWDDYEFNEVLNFWGLKD